MEKYKSSKWLWKCFKLFLHEVALWEQWGILINDQTGKTRKRTAWQHQLCFSLSVHIFLIQRIKDFYSAHTDFSDLSGTMNMFDIQLYYPLNIKKVLKNGSFSKYSSLTYISKPKR